MRQVRFNEALREAIREEMRRDENVIIFGEDIGAYGGLYRVTVGLLEEFGAKRVRNTPISEPSLVGAAIGGAIAGLRPICEIMVMDWFGLALDQLVNNATLRYTWGGQITIPMVIRTQGGAGRYSGAHHSKMLEVWPAHIPGIKVVMPSNPYDAKGLLKASIRDDNPVVFIESRVLYGKRAPVPEEEYIIELGTAKVVREGSDITVIAIQSMVQEAVDAAEILAEKGISVEVIDPRTLVPFDYTTVFESVKKTHRVLVVHSSWQRFGIGAEIASSIQEKLFDYLDAPVKRLAGIEVPIPASPALEPLVVPNKDKIVDFIEEMLG
jgi:pyruvate/2-oxoglutarate/acetoin dehydrogenase E1 component